MTRSGPGAGLRRVEAVVVPGIGEVAAGDDLGAIVVRACADAGVALGDGDVLAVASKVVAKAEGLQREATDRAAAVAAETVRVVAERVLPDGRTTRVVQSRSGPVLAAAGVDASDVPEGTVLVLPPDADASARALRARVHALSGARPAVLVTDTAGRPWRDGVTDFALGAAGLAVLDDTRGRTDRFGRPLEVTVRAVADEVAAMADLVKDKAAGTPVAVVRGLADHVVAGDGDGAARCVRVGPDDWFSHGRVEAVRAALGVDPGMAPPPPLLAAGDTPAARVERALAVLDASGRPAGVDVLPARGAGVVARLAGPALAVGVAAERLRVALWAEGVAAHVRETGDGEAAVVLDRVEQR